MDKRSEKFYEIIYWYRKYRRNWKGQQDGIICGVTTNPTLIVREGKDFIEVVKEITTVVNGPVSAEVISLKAEEMIKEAYNLADKVKTPNLVIKIPMTSDGLSLLQRGPVDKIRIMIWENHLEQSWYWNIMIEPNK